MTPEEEQEVAEDDILFNEWFKIWMGIDKLTNATKQHPLNRRYTGDTIQRVTYLKQDNWLYGLSSCV